MKKVLITSSVISFIEAFNKENIDYLKNKLGCETHVACNLNFEGNISAELAENFIAKQRAAGVVFHNVGFARSPLSSANFGAYKALKKIVDDEDFDLICCHTPVASLLTRWVARNVRKRGAKVKVAYTAHGFHFYRGAPLKNWLIYYPIERLCSRWTDALITINEEDYELAQKRMKAKKTYYVPGVGVDLKRFGTAPNGDVSEDGESLRNKTRRSLGIAPDDRVLIYVAELNENKNQTSLIDMLSELRKTRKDVKLVLIGRGEYDVRLKEKSARLGLSQDVILTGFRTDVPALLAAADVAVPSSIREGLPINVMEAMAVGLPVVAYDNRGHRSILEDGKSGFLVKNGDYVRMAEIVGRLLDDADEYRRVAEEGKRRVEIFGVDNVLKVMSKIYEETLR